MEIQVNSDKNVLVDSQVIRFIGAEVNRVLKRFAGRPTRVEVHLSDVNSHRVPYKRQTLPDRGPTSPTSAADCQQPGADSEGGP